MHLINGMELIIKYLIHYNKTEYKIPDSKQQIRVKILIILSGEVCFTIQATLRKVYFYHYHGCHFSAVVAMAAQFPGDQHCGSLPQRWSGSLVSLPAGRFLMFAHLHYVVSGFSFVDSEIHPFLYLHLYHHDCSPYCGHIDSCCKIVSFFLLDDSE